MLRRRSVIVLGSLEEKNQEIKTTITVMLITIALIIIKLAIIITIINKIIDMQLLNIFSNKIDIKKEILNSTLRQ